MVLIAVENIQRTFARDSLIHVVLKSKGQIPATCPFDFVFFPCEDDRFI